MHKLNKTKQTQSFFQVYLEQLVHTVKTSMETSGKVQIIFLQAKCPSDTLATVKY